MKWIVVVGGLVILFIFFLLNFIGRPSGDAAQTVAPTTKPNQQIQGDWNKDGVLDERDEALRHR